MQEEKIEQSTKKTNKAPILGAVALIAVSVISYLWWSSQGHESTKNAQVDAMITPVRSTVQGFITEVKFNDNQKVKKGDVLIVIDDKDYKSKVQQAEAALESAKAQLEIAKSGADAADQNAAASSLNSLAAKDNIASAQARFNKSEKELLRIEKMFKDGAATQQQLDAANADYEANKAQLNMLKNQYSAVYSQSEGVKSQADAQKSQIALAQAMVKQREAELQLANTQLENTHIRAPFDGIISKKSVETGQYMQIGAPVCSAVDINNLWVSANFKETQIAGMKLNQEVEIRLDAFPKIKILGTLQSFGGATGAKFSLLPPDNATGNFVKITQRVPVRIAITDYPKSLEGILMPGLSAEVDVHIN